MPAKLSIVSELRALYQLSVQFGVEFCQLSVKIYLTLLSSEVHMIRTQAFTKKILNAQALNFHRFLARAVP